MNLEWDEPEKIFRGVILVLAPHMDDCVLACGGTIASLPDKERIYFLYATDGSKSPAPAFPWQGPLPADLPAIRSREARKALGTLGVPEENIHFLDLPDGKLRRTYPMLRNSLREVFQAINPSCILAPFRYDRHPDHLALNRAAAELLPSAAGGAEIYEYFVYYRWQLIPGRDIRKHVDPGALLRVDIQGQSERKKQALLCFESQTSLYYPWQERPILPAGRVQEVSCAPEMFVRADGDRPGARVFARHRNWIRVIHTVEPKLKWGKDTALGLVRFVFRSQ